ncbi:hypothetical protein BDA96_03G080000 [Sorghum bicolor]|uniref:C2H2-type domain-containing protein n=3 Tax=Sorghum bicolor TaxID=4558 RepID=A0A921RBM3_SORBI|nr:hypothetical protein BDA96_03G080000 [Sorghum bicolor]OQU86343.1 hypothetical protein SORBI_3003G076400 [Sorghum bicolor]
MERNSYPTKDTRFRQSDNEISPLHEALRGKTTMPTLSSSEPNDHAHSFKSYYNNSEAIPHQLHSVSTPIPPTSIIASTRLEQSLKKEQELMRMFLTTPVSEDARRKALSLEPQSIKSLLQGDPMAILQAHFDIAGVSDPGPIFHDPALHVPKERMHKTLGSSSSSHDDLYGKIPYAKPTFFNQPPVSSLVQREQHVPSGFPSSNSYDAIKEVMGSTINFRRVKKQKYTCKLCSAVFSSQQMYHSHMSLLHSKGIGNN